MTRKVLIDCDPGIDDAVALCVALFDSRLDVLAVTATEGNVNADQSTRNVQAVVDQIDPPRYPRFGKSSALAIGPPIDVPTMHGADGLGNCRFEVSMLHHEHLSEKVICDTVRAHPEEVTILAMGPLTNIARALARDPDLASLIGRIVFVGGSVASGGNVTGAAEFNVYYDPEAARKVFHSRTTKTIVPLDVTRQVLFSIDFLEKLPSSQTRVGAFLHKIIPFAFRAHHQHLGLEAIYLHDAVAVMAALHPELFTTEDMCGDVETTGSITTGATVFDRRRCAHEMPNMEVAMQVDSVAVADGILRGLEHAGRLSA